MNFANWAFRFWQGWAYLAITLGLGSALFAYLRRADPKLLERRLRGPASESDTSQKLIQLGAVIVFGATLGLSLLDHRFAWSHVPRLVTIAADVLLASGYLVIFLAWRENTFAATNIVVEADQRVISTGPYGIVRHPYYSGLLLCWFATPPALGSFWGLLALLPMVLLIAFRIGYEERFLAERLRGYTTYCRNVRYRVVPRVW